MLKRASLFITVALITDCRTPAQQPSAALKDAVDPSYSIYDQGKECYDTLGVEVPTFDCDGPKSSRLKVEVDGQEVTDRVPDKCDKPDMVATPIPDGDDRFDCVPGGRVTKFSERNAKGQTVVTIVACRRTAFHPLDSGLYENIALIQSNLSTNDTCWFQIRAKPAMVARGILPPFAKDRVKGDAADQKVTSLYVPPLTLTSDNSECFRCHDNQTFLRTPWIKSDNQVKGAGVDNEIPRNKGLPHHVGKPFQAWNAPDLRPIRMKINAELLDQNFPPTAEEKTAMEAGNMASSDACTQCHPISKTKIAGPYEGTCNHFARFWMPEKGETFAGTAAGMRMTAYGAAFPRNAWMPPGADGNFNSDAEYQAYYKRAFKAIQLCCDDPTRAGCQQP